MFRCSGHQRPFWLTVALSVMLLVSVSITIAHAANPTRLAADLKRDLDALRIQLELIDPFERDPARQTIASNADLGDGGAAFQRQSMVTMVAAVNRRLERLIERYRGDGKEELARRAATLRLAVYDLREQVDRLARASAPAEVAALRDRVEAALDHAERGLEMLLAESPAASLPARSD